MDRNEKDWIMEGEPKIVPREEKVREAIARARAAYDQQEQSLTGWEFLWSQLRYTRKCWWVLQGALLLLAYRVLPFIEVHHHRVRSVGVIGCLFVVLIIPELWRNKSNEATQVEAACLYSLRQVYAARITLFGIVDVGMLTLFLLALGGLGFTWLEVLAQFLLPVTVTAWICFSLLCGRKNLSEAVSLSVCLTWSGAWWLLLRNEALYTMVLPAVWVALLGIALVLLGLAVRTAVRTTNQYWEVEFV